MPMTVFPIARDSKSALLDSIMSFLKTQLDDEQLQELAKVIGQSSGDDATEALRALNETTSELGVSGQVMPAQDARAIYLGAMKNMGVMGMDTWPSDLPATALRAMFKINCKRRRASGEPMIRPTAEAIRSFEERFPAAAKINHTSRVR